MKTGFFKSTELSNWQYHHSEGISKSSLDMIHRSPAHYKWSKTHPAESTPALRFGSALHEFILEPDLFQTHYEVLPEDYKGTTKLGKAMMEDIRKAGKEPLTNADFITIKGMREAVMANDEARNVLEGAQTELSMYAELMGTQCKARADIFNDGLFADLKTTKDASPKEFQKSFYNFRYHVQAAWYSEVYKKITGETPVGFMFIAVEKEPPYGVTVCVPSDLYITMGKMTAYQDLETYLRCLETDTWPCYPPDLMVMEPPKWAQ